MQLPQYSRRTLAGMVCEWTIVDFPEVKDVVSDAELSLPTCE